MTIYTDEHGVPIPGDPGELRKGATYKEWRDWSRAKHEYEAKVADHANRTFAREFKKALAKKDDSE